MDLYLFALLSTNAYCWLYGRVLIRIVEHKYLQLAIWTGTQLYCWAQILTLAISTGSHTHYLTQIPSAGYYDLYSFVLLRTNTYQWLYGLVLIRIFEHKYLLLDMLTCTLSHCWAQIPTAEYVDWFSFALLNTNTYCWLY